MGFNPSRDKGAATAGSEPGTSVERTGRFEDAPLAYTAEFRPVKLGIEAIISIINQGDDPVSIASAMVDCRVDGRRLGLHALLFPAVADPTAIVLDQFELVEGRFHIPATGGASEVSTLVYVDYSRGGRAEREQIPLKVETRSFTRA